LGSGASDSTVLVGFRDDVVFLPMTPELSGEIPQALGG